VIRVLVVEDSAVTREYLVALLGQDREVEVVGAARDGLEAVEQVQRLRPDVIVMDIHMPRMDGLEATRRIMGELPTPIVLVTATLDPGDAALSFEAIRAGALTVLSSPTGPGHSDQATSARELVETVKLMAEVKVVRRWPRREQPAERASPLAAADRRVSVVAIGASTGGPAVLAQILAELPRTLAAPVLVVQHITPGFAGGLADWLRGETPLTVVLARADDVARPGCVYVAPDAAQMGIGSDGRIRLAACGRDDGLCPSASHLFESVAAAYGGSAMGVLLTGMGRDGAAGLHRLRLAGGITVAQDEASSVVFGMPGEAVRQGAAEHVLPPEGIARLIRTLAARKDTA
jgi:two-component system chemotaxis response regulator CheB